MKNLSTLDWIALTLVTIGAVNWGLIGFFAFDLVGFLFGPMTALSRLLYALVGLSGVYMAFDAFRLGRKEHMGHMQPSHSH